MRARLMKLTPKQILAIPCPTCGAAPGVRCQLATGQSRTGPHRDRRLIATESRGCDVPHLDPPTPKKQAEDARLLAKLLQRMEKNAKGEKPLLAKDDRKQELFPVVR
jgi:hypothetical protein